MNTSPFRCLQNGNASTQTSNIAEKATHSNGPVWWLIGTVPSQCPSYLELVWSGWVKKNIKSMWRATSICSKSHQTWSQTSRTGQQVPGELEACYSVQVPVLFLLVRLLSGLCVWEPASNLSRAERTDLGAQERVAAAACSDQRNSVRTVSLSITPSFYLLVVKCFPVVYRHSLSWFLWMTGCNSQMNPG